MKFPGIYAVLEARAKAGPGLSVNDRSNWRKPVQGIVDHMIPLWIIVEDKKINKRVWITKSSGQLEVAAAQLDLNPKSAEYSKSYVRMYFRTQGKMAAYLTTLFGITEQKTAA